MANHASSLPTGNGERWGHQAHLARRQAERARRLAREFANDNISRNLTEVADELEEAADELDRRARAIAAGTTPTAH